MATETDSKQPRHLSWVLIVIRTVLVILTVIIDLGLIISAYAGKVNPEIEPVAALAGMTLPAWILGAIVLMLLTFIAWWKLALFQLTAFLLCLSPILDYCPLHFFTKKAPDGQPEFTLMTYNTYGFVNQYNVYPGDRNQTLSYILDSDADIVCLQESPSLAPDAETHITEAQVDSLHKLYPYVFKAGRNQNVLSKFPIEPVATGFEPGEAGTLDLACYRAMIHGRKVTIFNVHMRSFWLEYDERELYLGLTEGHEEDMSVVRNKLLKKIAQKCAYRAREVHELIGYIRRFAGPDAIVCGDFNDVPGCFSLRQLEKHSDLHSVVSEVGFGPMITYNADRFYFRIDHILYRGTLEPLSVKRGDIRSSDHYPLTATFTLKEK